MEFKDFLNYISNNLIEICKNFNLYFGLNQEEIEHILKKLITDVASDRFYKKILAKKDLTKCFSNKTLYSFENYLSNHLHLKEENIKNILINTPQILFFAPEIVKIYPIFKGSDFKGFALLNDNEYKAYSFYSNSKYILKSNKVSKDVNVLLPQNVKVNYINFINRKTKYDVVKNDVFDNSKLVNYLLENLNRQDVMKYYGLTNDSTLEEKFEAISTDYNKRDYYFKRPKK